jgi:hypothetical protein
MSQTIFFDESGFTGPYLSDPDQPYFVYSSVAISPEQADRTVAQAVTDFRLLASELKGSKLVKTGRGRDATSFLIKECGPISQSVVIHKKYALACKLFEYIFEPALSEKIGIFYHLGFHKFVSTLLFAELLTNDGSAEELLENFQGLMRARGVDGITAFFQQPAAKKQTRSMAKEIVAFAHGQRHAIEEELDVIGSLDNNVGRWTLDLTITALNSLLCYWGEKFDQLDVYCDESKPLESYFAAKDNPFALMVGRTDKQYLEFDGYKRPVTFNLVRPISLASSTNHTGLQIADVIAASISYVLKNRLDETAKEWSTTLLATIHQESIFPDWNDADARTDRGALNMLVLAELVRRSRMGIDVLDGIEDFLRFPYADIIQKSIRKAQRELRQRRKADT